MSEMIKNEGFSLEDIDKITDVASHIKNLEKKLIRYEPALEYASESIIICNEKGNILYVNKKHLELTGLQRKDRVGKNIYEVNPNGLLAQVLTTKKPIFDVITTAQGTNGYGIANGYPLFQDEELIGAVIFGKDYSQAIQLSHKLSERELYLTEFYRRSSKYFFSDIITNNPKMQEIIMLARKVSQNENPVALVGETGTGKDLIAQAIHSTSNRNKKPFFKFNCTEFTEERTNYELFGYEKNAFPEATNLKLGLLELLSGGTIYLENIQELPASSQSKLIQFLRDGKLYKIGGTESISFDVRVIVSFNKPVKEVFINGLINEELYKYLINNCIHLPPLRERIEDIADLVHYFIKKISRNTGKQVKGIRQEALELLRKYSWPGNVRELETVVRMIILTLERDLITLEHVLSRLPVEFNEQIDNRILPLEEVEKIAILNALKVHGDTLNGKKQAAENLKISMGTLYNKLRKYGISVRK